MEAAKKATEAAREDFEAKKKLEQQKGVRAARAAGAAEAAEVARAKTRDEVTRTANTLARLLGIENDYAIEIYKPRTVIHNGTDFQEDKALDADMM
jgi:hypothetical protein